MKILNKVYCMIFLTICIAICSNIYGTTISTTSSSPKVGDTFTVSIKVSNVATWQLNVSYDTSKLQLVSGSTTLARSDDGVDNVNATAGTLTFKAKAEGTGSISVSGNSYTNDETPVPAGASTNITVSAAAPPPVVTPVVAPVVTAPVVATPSTSTTTVSTNANLKNLYVNIEGMGPAFNKSKLNYLLTVNKNINDVVVTAISEDSKATFYVNGNKNLKAGENLISITVTAPDKKTVKTYKITVSKTNNPELADANLENLIIEDAKITTEFDTSILEYSCEEIESSLDKLTILAFSKNKDAKVEIIGNEGLKAGENIIKIKVTAVNGTTTKEYIIKVNKKEALPATTENVDIYGEKDNLQGNTPSKFKDFLNTVGIYLRTFWLVLTLFAFILFEFAQIVYLYLKVEAMKKENKNDVEENNETNETIFSRRKKTESKPADTNTSWLTDTNKEEAIDDISDELVDSSNVSKISEDNTDNFEDSIDLEDDNK